MAAQVLSGTGPLTYTNNTGENVRIVINFIDVGSTSGTMSFGGGASVNLYGGHSYGKNLAFISASSSASLIGSGVDGGSTQGSKSGVPMELGLASGDTFSISSPSQGPAMYNIIVIPESG